MKPKIPENLTVVGLEHDKNQAWSIAAIRKLIYAIGKGKTLFIEGSGHTWKYSIVHGEGDTFSAAYLSARGLKWKIVNLDREPLTDIYFNHPRTRVTPPIGNYILYNLREKDWVRRIIQAKPVNGGIILIHPNHVRGFLQESGLTSKNVVWINKPVKMKSKRLTKREVESLKSKRWMEKTGTRRRKRK